MMQKYLKRKECHVRVDGLNISYQSSGNPKNPPLICFHGWQDNLNSFHYLVPGLSQAFHVIAVDFPGHGKSEGHRHSAHYFIFEYVVFVYELLSQLKITKAHFLGHSLGGAVLALFAASFPEKVKKLSVIEALGPWTSQGDATLHLRHSILESHKRCLASKKKPYYNTKKEMYQKRVDVSDMKLPVVEVLLNRSILKTTKGYTWRTDPFVKGSSRLRMTERQLLEFLRKIQTQVLFIQGDPGINGVPQNLIEDRMKAVPLLVHKTVKGGHHVHLENPEEVLKHLLEFHWGGA